MRLILIFAGISGAVAVWMGAAAAHWLQASMEAATIARIEKAATYQMYHSLALLAVAAIAQHHPSRLLGMAAGLMMLGILCFSGSLYFYSFSEIRALMWVTPLGGIAWIAAWLTLAVAGWRIGRRASSGTHYRH